MSYTYEIRKYGINAYLASLQRKELVEPTMSLKTQIWCKMYIYHISCANPHTWHKTLNAA